MLNIRQTTLLMFQRALHFPWGNGALLYSHIPAHNMLSWMDLCTGSSFPKRWLFPAHTGIFYVVLNFINSVCFILCFSFVPLCVCFGVGCVSMCVSVGGGLWMHKKDLRLNFYIILYRSVAFSPQPLFLFLAPSLLSPDDSHPSMKSIFHLVTGRHWHAAHAIWWLMAKLYDPVATEWQSTVTGQLLYLSDVFVNFVTGSCYKI